MSLHVLRRETCAPDLVVLLPGAYMKARDMVQAGFFAAVEERGLALDVALVDLDPGAISGGTALPAVLTQVLEPARQQGRRRIWLGGISLGGLLALCQAADAPASVDGLCLIAPYPGSRLTLDAIDRAGGLRAWRATAEQLLDPEFRAWRWLQQPPAAFPVFVGYGTEDRFSPRMRQLAECLPPASRCTVPGGHDWPAWCELWGTFLDRGQFTH